MARDRSIVVRLRAEVSDFKREMNAAAEAARKVGKDTEATGKGAQTVLGGMVRSATQNRDAWNTTGTALVGVGAAVTGIGVAALKTGIEYNTLQQTTRAALTTLLGSAQAANAQMDKLDDFARTSPFAKQVFIQAQQQLIGFGMSAERVIPTLDAVQNAVAGVGGSNQDIAELVNVIAKIGAEGKITAVHLQQFGSRGIEAAELIGQGMGKTGAEIREAITAGTLDADAAVQALVLGMQEKFGGSAENVKNTFAGAIDRVKAAWRDMAAELAKPLVNPDGGGGLIDLANRLADVMQAVRQLPEPIKNTVAALGGLSGVAALTGGSMMLLLPRLIDTRNAVRTLRQDMPRLASALGKVGKAAAVLGTLAVLNSVGASVDRTISSTEEWINKLEGVKGSAEPLPDLFGQIKPPEDFTQFLAEVGDTGFWASIDNAVGGFANNMANLLGLDARSEWTKQRDALLELGGAIGELSARDLPSAQEAFAALAASTDGSDEALRNLLSAMPEYEDALYGAANAAGMQLTETDLLRVATGDLEFSTDEAAEAQSEFKAALDEVNDQIGTQIDRLSALTDALSDSASAVLDSREAERKWLDALDDTREAIKENGKTLDISTEKGRANEEQLDRLIDIGWERIEYLRETTSSEKELQDAMSEVRAEVIKAAEDMGMSGIEAERFADRLGLIPRDIHIDIEARTEAAERNISRLMERWSGRQITLYAKWVASGVSPPKGHPAGQADGSVRVRSFAGGGFSSLPKHAVIQRATPGLIQWAEPETQGEAFIPLAPSKRRRSLAIWEETGRRLGALESRAFANGGFNVPSPVSSSAVSLSDSDVARIAAAVRDGSAAGVSAGFSGGRSGVARVARMGGF